MQDDPLSYEYLTLFEISHCLISLARYQVLFMVNYWLLPRMASDRRRRALEYASGACVCIKNKNLQYPIALVALSALDPYIFSSKKIIIQPHQLAYDDTDFRSNL